MDIKIAPSLLAADFMKLGSELERAELSGADMLHCDVMDGIYVPNLSFGFDIIKQIHKTTSLPLDVHMMTAAPDKYIELLAENGASSVNIHTDCMEKEKIRPTLENIVKCGMKAAIALRPRCPASDALEYLDLVDMILVMTVEPGFGGQKFMADMMPKVSEIRRYLDLHKPECSVQVDGGISPSTIETAAGAGADNFVVGTASFRAPNMTAAVADIRKAAYDSYAKNI